MILVSYNIQYGFGRDGRYDLSRAADVLKSADIARVSILCSPFAYRLPTLLLFLPADWFGLSRSKLMREGRPFDNTNMNSKFCV